MSNLINTIFGFAKTLFDSIPGLAKLKGYRTVIGFIGLAVLAILQAQGIGDTDVMNALNLGFTGFTALALNAKDNPVPPANG